VVARTNVGSTLAICSSLSPHLHLRGLPEAHNFGDRAPGTNFRSKLNHPKGNGTIITIDKKSEQGLISALSRAYSKTSVSFQNPVLPSHTSANLDWHRALTVTTPGATAQVYHYDHFVSPRPLLSRPSIQATVNLPTMPSRARIRVSRLLLGLQSRLHMDR